MTTLEVRPYTMPSASMRTDNPLPDIQANADVHARIAIDETTITPDEAKYMGVGRVNGILPYTIRDGYDRTKKPKAWKSVVIENDFLTAVFLPELGGRLWSLVDKETGRELLHKNPVFQPCNLALRNAWISGGVEWNLGIIGHTPFTVDSLHAERLQLPDGTPVLRMYQYERVRGINYQINALLPEGAKQLIVHVKINNTGEKDTYMYWWSNMAVDEREDVRVVVPASRAFRFGYGGKLAKVDVPYYDGIDISHTTNIPYAVDFFFDLPEGQRRFISAIDGKGYGFIQSSTDALMGRKLFVWGMGKGGRNWQSFLAQPGCAYLEIQAGLAHTQLEHLPMKGGQTVVWTEAYGAVSADAKLSNDPDFGAAARAVEASLEERLPRAALDAMEARLIAELVHAKGEVIHRGDGWGYVEARARGEKFLTGGVEYAARTAGMAEREWLALLDKGMLPEPGPLSPPKGYQVSDLWFGLLKKSIDAGGSDHWYGWYQLGVMHAYRNEASEAEKCFVTSLERARSPWALRCLAVLKKQAGDANGAADLWLEAVSMLRQRNLAIEAVRALVDAKRYAEAETLCATLPAAIRKLGRIKTLRIEAMVELGRAREALRMLRSKIELTDVREGEVSLTDLWFRACALEISKREGVELSDALIARAQEECPPPDGLDFRMK